MTLVIKKIDEEKLRLFKAEAVKRGLLLSQALEEAIDLWLNLNPTDIESDVEVNNRVYERMRQELLKKHNGRFILIAEGRLIGVFEDAREAMKTLRKLGPHIKHAILTKIGSDEQYSGEYEWWGGSIEPHTAQNI